MVQSETTGRYGASKTDRKYMLESELLTVYGVLLSFHLSRVCKVKDELCLVNLAK